MIRYKALAEFCRVYSEIVKDFYGFLGRRKCYICGKNFFKYLPIYNDAWYRDQLKENGINFHFTDATYNRNEYRCPYCGAIDRTRFLMLYIHKNYRIKRNIKLLYFAPVWGGLDFLRKKMKNIKVHTADLYEDKVDYQLDIQNLEGIDDAAYDLIICSHVLEHVDHDKAALKELYRVLKYGGEALILVPLDLKRGWFDEELGLSPHENWKRFGQGDHVRRYTHVEIIKRIREAGFQCKMFTRSDVEERLVKENAFMKNIRIYRAKKERLHERI